MIENIVELNRLIRENTEYKISIKVSANSKINSIEFLNDFIKIKITARAVEGKANKAIIEYLSSLLDFPKSKISIIAGIKSSYKTILFKNG